MSRLTFDANGARFVFSIKTTRPCSLQGLKARCAALFWKDENGLQTLEVVLLLAVAAIVAAGIIGFGMMIIRWGKEAIVHMLLA